MAEVLDYLDDDEVVLAPCEHCGDLFPIMELYMHETGCNPELTSYAPYEVVCEDEQPLIDLRANLNNIAFDNYQTSSTSASVPINNEVPPNNQTRSSTADKTSEKLDPSPDNASANSNILRPQVSMPSTFAETLSENNPRIFNLSKNSISNMKTNKTKEVTNKEKTADPDDLAESLFQSFVRRPETSKHTDENFNTQEEDALSDDDDSGETIEQFWARAEIFLKKRLEDLQRQGRNREMNFSKKSVNYGGRGAY